MINNKAVTHGLRAATIVVALGLTGAAAQQIVYPASNSPTPGPMAPLLQRYAPVTPERLLHPEDADWLLFRRTYDGWGYSPLAEITPANVSRLQPVWTFATGQVEGHQAPPMVNNGVMFVATPGNQLLTIDARTGAVLWRYKTTDPRRHDAAPFDQPRRRPL